MYIILFLIIIIISSILSFITSGIEHIFRLNDPNWYMLPVGYFFVIYSTLLYLVYRLKFKKVRVLKFYFLRKLLTLNRMFTKIDSKVYSSNIEISSLQERSIKNWNSLLLDKTTILSTSLISQDRTIQRGSLLVVLRSNPDTTLTAFGVNLYYETFIPQLYSNEMISNFDKEQEKRMKMLESKKRSHIELIISNKL